MMSTARLSVRLFRFELTAVVSVLVLASALAVLAAASISGLAPPARCFEPYVDMPPPGCEAAGQAFYEAQSLASPLVIVLAIGPALAGALLGVPIVAREVERGTARLAWSLTPSRTRWFAGRVVVSLLVLVAVAYLAGAASDRLHGAFRPDVDLTHAFDSYGLRGIIVAARALLVFGVAVAVGAWLGRVLPALLVGAGLATALLVGGTMAQQAVMATETVATDPAMVATGDLWMDQRFRLPDGSLVGWAYFVGSEDQLYDELGNSRYPEVAMVVPGARYRFTEARETIALLGASAVALVVAGLLVERRRPD